jgi:small redox-active disulfide protein 2
MKIQILGTGCAKCKQLTQHAEEAVAQLAIDCQVEKVTEMDEILSFGIMMTPGLALDGEVLSSGRVLSVDKIKELLDAKASS